LAAGLACVGIIPSRADGALHIVQKGDTLWELAWRYLDDGYRWTEIQAANGGIDPHRLPIGMALQIPSEEDIGAAEEEDDVIGMVLDAFVSVHFAPESNVKYRFQASEAGFYQLVTSDIAEDLYNSAPSIKMLDAQENYVDSWIPRGLPSDFICFELRQNQIVYFFLDPYFNHEENEITFKMKVQYAQPRPQPIELQEDQSVIVTINSKQPCQSFTFTPPDDGWYRFCTDYIPRDSEPYAEYAHQFDPYGRYNTHNPISVWFMDENYMDEAMGDCHFLWDREPGFQIDILNSAGLTYYFTVYDMMPNAVYSVKLVRKNLDGAFPFRENKIRLRVGESVPIEKHFIDWPFPEIGVSGGWWLGYGEGYLWYGSTIFSIEENGTFLGRKPGQQTITFFSSDRQYQQDVTFIVKPRAWWQGLSPWLQWPLRYICFGWVWMN